AGAAEQVGHLVRVHGGARGEERQQGQREQVAHLASLRHGIPRLRLLVHEYTQASAGHRKRARPAKPPPAGHEEAGYRSELRSLRMRRAYWARPTTYQMI